MNNPRNFILIALAIGLFYTFTSPQYQKVKTLQASANEYQNVIENVSKIAEARDALLVGYEAIPVNERDRLFKVLPDNVDSVRLALDLDTIAGRYGIAIKNVRVNTQGDSNSAQITLPDYGGPFEKAVVTFSFVSNYENFIRLLSDLEKSLRIMDIKSVVFRVADANLYEHEIQVETYWLK